MKFGFVCTNYNNTDYTRKAVYSLLQRDPQQWVIVIVDNDSDRDNVDALEELASEFENVEIILSDENVGYFRGLNLGIRHLRSTHPEIEFVVVGNNDLLFPTDFAECLGNCLSTFQRYAVISPDIVTLDGLHQNPHVIKKIGTFRELIYDLYYLNYGLAILIKKIAELTQRFTDRTDETQHDVAQVIYQGYGACYVLGPLFFQHCQELWAPSFLMHEEYFLSKQLSDQGLCVFYEPTIRVIHQCHAATDKVPGKRMWQAARDAHKVYRQYVKIIG